MRSLQVHRKPAQMMMSPVDRITEDLVHLLSQWRCSATGIDEEAYRLLIHVAYRLDDLTAALETIIRLNNGTVDVARRALRAHYYKPLRQRTD
jgi:hypothetical protein